MKKIPCPLPEPSPAEIESARTDKTVRERVRKQLWRVRRRDEEIARLKSEIADPDVGGDDGDLGDLGDNYDDDTVIRYVCISPEYCNVLCRSVRTRSFVLTRRIAIPGFLPGRTEQHT